MPNFRTAVSFSSLFGKPGILAALIQELFLSEHSGEFALLFSWNGLNFQLGCADSLGSTFCDESSFVLHFTSPVVGRRVAILVLWLLMHGRLCTWRDCSQPVHLFGSASSAFQLVLLDQLLVFGICGRQFIHHLDFAVLMHISLARACLRPDPGVSFRLLVTA